MKTKRKFCKKGGKIMKARNLLCCIGALGLVAAAGAAFAGTLTDKEKLGKNLYFDIRLSNPAGQSCASCHSPGAGFNGIGDASITAFEGAVAGRAGNRNPPSAAYASFSPDFGYDLAEGMYIGGQFWDGRAKDLVEQAKGPFLNPVEMNNTKEEVVSQVKNSNYANLFSAVYGANNVNDVETAYNAIADAIAAYEKSTEVNRFSSKYDWYLKNKKSYPLSEQEKKGLALFNDPFKGNCAACHPSDGVKPQFTDFSYDNLGMPKNSAKTVAADLGLGAIVNDPAEYGKFKVPTLRNVGVAPPYGHNGYFKTLKEIVHFYNTRDVKNEKWPAPEVPVNVNTDELGNLGLSGEEEDAIVTFLMTLTDGYMPPNKR
jgi:cytochrome c peroxidase